MKSLSRVRLLVTSWAAAYQAPPSMGFSRQEYWSGVPLPSPKLRLIEIKLTCLRSQSTLGSWTGTWKQLALFYGGGHGNPLLYSCLENPHGEWSLAGYNPWGRKESDTERLNTAHYYISSTSDHQALNPRGWGPLFYRTHLFNPQWSHHLRSLIWYCICKEPISKGHILGLGNGGDIGRYYQPLYHPIDVLWVLNYFIHVNCLQ